MIWTSLVAQGKRRLWMSLFVAVFLALVYFHFARFYQGRVSTWILVLAAIPVFLNLARAALGLTYRLERHPFRSFDLGLSTDQVGPGQSVEMELVLETRRAVRMRELRVAIQAVRQRITERGRASATLHQDVRSVAGEVLLEPGARKSYRVRIPVPEGAPYSYRSMEGKIVWSIRVEAEVEGWGELRDELELTVAPG